MNFRAEPISDEDQAAIRNLAGRLASLVAPEKTNLIRDAVYKPVPNSQIDLAMKAKIGDAYELAGQRLVSAEDHFRSLRTLLGPESVLPHFSMFTLTRAAGLATVHARHLLDEKINETQRLARALSARLKNLREQHDVLAPLDPPMEPPDPFKTWDEFLADRVGNLEKRAIANGIPVGRKKNSEIVGFDTPWPTDTALFDLHMPGFGKTWFKYLSGYAHSLPWALLPRHRAKPSDDPAIQLVPTDIHVPDLVAVLNGAMNLYDDTIRIQVLHAGYPAMVWEQTKKG